MPSCQLIPRFALLETPLFGSASLLSSVYMALAPTTQNAVSVMISISVAVQQNHSNTAIAAWKCSSQNSKTFPMRPFRRSSTTFWIHSWHHHMSPEPLKHRPHFVLLYLRPQRCIWIQGGDYWCQLGDLSLKLFVSLWEFCLLPNMWWVLKHRINGGFSLSILCFWRI